MRIGEIHSDLQTAGFAWRTQWQVRYRLKWLEAAGLVERVASRYPQYALTRQGRAALEES
jgi:repressor of nif and glnA expression